MIYFPAVSGLNNSKASGDLLNTSQNKTKLAALRQLSCFVITHLSRH